MQCPQFRIRSLLIAATIVAVGCSPVTPSPPAPTPDEVLAQYEKEMRDYQERAIELAVQRKAQHEYTVHLLNTSDPKSPRYAAAKAQLEEYESAQQERTDEYHERCKELQTKIYLQRERMLYPNQGTR